LRYGVQVAGAQKLVENTTHNLVPAALSNKTNLLVEDPQNHAQQVFSWPTHYYGSVGWFLYQMLEHGGT
jgi:hypothetical protein